MIYRIINLLILLIVCSAYVIEDKHTENFGIASNYETSLRKKSDDNQVDMKNYEAGQTICVVTNDNKFEFEKDAKTSFNECGTIIVNDVKSLSFHEKIAIKADIVFTTSGSSTIPYVTIECPHFDDDLFVIRSGITATFQNVRFATCDMNGENLFVVKEESSLVIESGIFKLIKSNNGGVFKVTDGGSLTLKNVEARKNVATSSGGVINCDSGSLVIDSGNFFGNSASNNGGVIYSSNCKFSISNSDFNRNKASSQAGAIGAYNGSEGKVTRGLFKKNVSYSGGAFYITDSTLELINCRLAENYAAYRGGAINAYIGGKLVTTTSVFTNNTSADNGGDIKSKDSSIDIISSVFEGAKSGKDGGSLSLNDGTTTISSSTFTKCNAQGVGGAMLLRNDISKLNSVTVTQCHCLSNGGGLKIDEGGEALVTASTFTHNNASNGGAFYVDVANLVIEKLSCGYNEANVDGGCLYVGDNDLKITYSDFYKNAAYEGGDISARNVSFSINSTAFVESYASYIGGSFVSSGYARGDFNLCEFNDNVAGKNGGAFDIYNSTIGMFSCKFNNNGCKSQGGAIRSNIYDRHLTLSQCTFKGNHASQGSCVYAIGTQLDVLTCNFDDNYGTETGVIHLNKSPYCAVNYTTFSNNICDGQGGSAFIESQSGILFFGSKFYDSFARVDGGILFMKNECQAFVTNTKAEDPASIEGKCFVGQSGRESYFAQVNNQVTFTDPKLFEYCAKAGYDTAKIKLSSP